MVVRTAIVPTLPPPRPPSLPPSSLLFPTTPESASAPTPLLESSSSFSVHANSGAVRVGATQLHASPATLSVGAAFEFDTSTALPTLRTLGNLHVNGSLHAGGELSADSTNELAQWSLVASDLFSEPVSGWTVPLVVESEESSG